MADPSPFARTLHFAAVSIHEAWIDTSHLPRHRADDDARLIHRWMQATGAPPA